MDKCNSTRDFLCGYQKHYMQIGFNKPESQVKSRMKNDKPVEIAIKAILALFFVVPHFEKLSRNLPQQPG